MPTEAELRTLFQDTALPTGGIDAASIIRRSKRRRLPRQVGAGSVLTLAVAGIGVASFTGLRPLTVPTTADSAAESSADSPMTDSPMGVSGSQLFDDGTKRAPAEKLNLCGAGVTEPAPSASGLELTMRFPDTAAATGSDVPGVVTLTNTAARAISGAVTARPVITVAQGGTTLWHSNGPALALQNPIELAPGESLDYETSFTPVRCSTEDELDSTGLPALARGEYQLTAVIDFFPHEGPVELISGPAATILLK